MSYKYSFHLPERYKLRGFERDLAIMELSPLGELALDAGPRTVQVTTDTPLPEEHLTRLTFFEQVTVTKREETHAITPYQTLLDRCAKATKLVTRKANLEEIARQLPSIENGRREHSYLTHSYHQYKGKYYPQLCKSLFNYGGLKPGDAVLDPFCGSGTTMVEAYLNSLRGVGVDLNPLAAFMSNVKVEALEVEPQVLRQKTERLIADLKEILRARGLWDTGLEDLEWTRPSRELSSEELAERIEALEIPNLDYLTTWFEPLALYKLGLILEQANELDDYRIRGLATLTVSNIIRPYSLQAPGQLRVRRRATPPATDDILYHFSTSLRKNVAAVFLFHAVKPCYPFLPNSVRSFEGDIRRLDQVPSPLLQEDEQIDMVVTSPPYATALPYIDTDRLSIFMLGFIEKDQRRDLERRMIGNREITNSERKMLEAEFLESYETSPLPDSVKTLVKEILERNAAADVGFRRRNKASLLYKYFADMREGFLQIRRVLKPSRLCAVIIGNSTTVAGGKRVEIRTNDLLVDIGRSVGFELAHSMPMTDQAAYMAHSKNTIRTETIFILRKT
jgi:DNA modification methylase